MTIPIDSFEFEKRWLNERYRYDVQARNEGIENLALCVLDRMPSVCICDVGSGLGANVRYYSPLLDCDQKWILVENSKRLALAARQALRQWALERNWENGETEEGLEVQIPGKAVRIEFRHESFLDSSFVADLKGVDLVVANAVFDLISKDQFEAFTDHLCASRVPMLSTLNYKSTRFSPSEREDIEFVALYERHMERLQGFGHAMGPHAVPQMTHTVAEKGGFISKGKSVWFIDESDRKMAQFLLAFFERAVSEVAGSQQTLSRFASWLERKRTQSEKETLEIIVEHADFFASFDPAGTKV